MIASVGIVTLFSERLEISEFSGSPWGWYHGFGIPGFESLVVSRECVSKTLPRGSSATERG